MPRRIAFISLLALALNCSSSFGQPVAEGVKLPPALTSADLRFSPDSNKLLVMRHYGEGTAPLLTIHDAGTDARLQGRSIYFPLSSPDLLAASRYEPVSARFGPSGNVILTTANKTARLWDISKGVNALRQKPVSLDLPGSSAAAFATDGKQLLTASLNKENPREQARLEVRIWDGGTGKPIAEPGTATIPEHSWPGPKLKACAFAPDGAFFLTAAGAHLRDAKTVQLWDVKTMKLIGEPLPAVGSMYHIGPDGKTLMAISQREITLWDIAARKPVCSLPTPEIAKLQPNLGNDLISETFAVHPNGTSVLYLKDDQVTLWDFKGEKPVEKVTLKHTGEERLFKQVNRIAISKDGKQAATACLNKEEVLVWSLETGKALLKIPHSRQVLAMEFSPDGRQLATADAGDVHLWKLETRK